MNESINGSIKEKWELLNCWIDWLIKENEWSHFEAVVVEEELAFAGENEEFGLDLFFEAGLALVVEDAHAFLE